MKRSLFAFIALVAAAPLFAEVALVYKSEDDVKKTVFSQGVVTTQGVVVSAEGLLAAGDKLLVGLQGQELMKAILVRFDNDLNLALIRSGESVGNDALQAAHKKNSDRLSLFLPELGQVPAIEATAFAASSAPSSAEKFVIKLNGVLAGAEPVALEKKRKKANVKIEILGQNIVPTWRVTFNLEAQPSLSFWKRNEERGLNSIPSRTLHYSHQVLFRPFSNGSSISVPIEISNIKEENYELVLKIDYKEGTYESKIPVRFTDK